MQERILEDRSRHRRVAPGRSCQSRPAVQVQPAGSISPHSLTGCSATDCRAAADSTAISLPSPWHRRITNINYCVRGGHKPALWPWPTSRLTEMEK